MVKRHRNARPCAAEARLVWCHIYECVQIDAVRDLDMMQEGAQRDRFTAKVAWNRCPLRESVVSIRRRGSPIGGGKARNQGIVRVLLRL